MNEELPKKISKYEILKVLGEGAMGRVYLGLDSLIDRQVAIKTLTLKTEHSELDQQRFTQEAKSLAQCNHPNIVTLLEFGYHENVAFLVMEYVKGSHLKRWLRKQDQLPLKQALSVFFQLLKALHKAHGLGIIHRDIKPENVLMANSSTIKLSDFGVAKASYDDSKTQIGMTVGTPRYMAPEQMFGTHELGSYTDIYALFVILYEMLGQVKYTAGQAVSSLSNINELAKHNQFSPDTLIPDELIPVLIKGLSVSPQERYQNAQQVAKDIKKAMSQMQGSPSREDETETSSQYLSSGSILSQGHAQLDIEKEELQAIREYMTEVVGVMADFIVNKSTKGCATRDQFIMNVAEKIDNPELRAQFLTDWR